MTTDNPKISAYVPPIIYDRFKQFKEERNLSFSQAAIEIFAEYFDVDLASNSVKENTGGLLDRVKQLEQIVADLKQSYIYLTEKVDLVQSGSGLPKSELNNLLNIHNESLTKPLERTPSAIPSEPEDELPIIKHLTEQENKLVDDSSTLSISQSEPLNLLPHQDKKDDNPLSNPPSELDIKVNYLLLAQRLGATEGYIKNKKSTSGSFQEFTKWSTEKDPDKIGWESIKEGRSVYFIPASNLSDEQKANLQDWLAKNQNPVE